MTPTSWPTGTGQWERLEEIRLSSEGRGTTESHVRTPLELIALLERSAASIVLVSLAGEFAQDEIAATLSELYPSVAFRLEAA